MALWHRFSRWLWTTGCKYYHRAQKRGMGIRQVKMPQRLRFLLRFSHRLLFRLLPRFLLTSRVMKSWFWPFLPVFSLLLWTRELLEVLILYFLLKGLQIFSFSNKNPNSSIWFESLPKLYLGQMYFILLILFQLYEHFVPTKLVFFLLPDCVMFILVWGLFCTFLLTCMVPSSPFQPSKSHPPIESRSHPPTVFLSTSANKGLFLLSSDETKSLTLIVSAAFILYTFFSVSHILSN